MEKNNGMTVKKHVKCTRIQHYIKKRRKNYLPVTYEMYKTDDATTDTATMIISSFFENVLEGKLTDSVYQSWYLPISAFIMKCI